MRRFDNVIYISSRRRNTGRASVTGVQTGALPIYHRGGRHDAPWPRSRRGSCRRAAGGKASRRSDRASLYTKFFFDEMGGITAFDEPLAHSGVEALVSVAIDRRIVEDVHCGKAVLEIATAAHVAPATFAAGRGRGVRDRQI